ncbi:CYTH domain-containing protein [Litorimonas sp. WD9-15]|uniref:CYTH domain-containing protein n=1 Tax=Litorimonas sp. WD9-15 TaxID=3418716 RepID=UPI003D005578
MGIEIERKFLVKNDAWRTGTPTLYVQGYLNPDKNRTVRVRIAETKAMITVKGITTGPSRAEYEYPIPLEDAQNMLKLCKGPLIEKHRWFYRAGDLTWEIDEFFGPNAGLIVAEIELDHEDQNVDLPDWVGREVTDDNRYFNSSLSVTPFTTWAKVPG